MKKRTSRTDSDRKRKRVVVAAARKRYTLDDLMKRMTPKAMHEAYDWGPERGREIVDE